MKATLTFSFIDLAKDFSVRWGRKTLTGHDMSRVKTNGSVDVTVYDVDEDKKAFIDSYIAGMNVN